MLKFIFLIPILLITGCSTCHDLQAPSSYCDRSGAGPVIPLQQTLICSDQ